MESALVTQAKTSIPVELADRSLCLRADGTVWCAEFETLLVGDLHLGKESSFRAAGVPVPDGATQTTLQLLQAAIDSCRPRKLILLGDLLHDRAALSDETSRMFQEFCAQNSKCSMTLVLGNHDQNVDIPTAWALEIHDRAQLDEIELKHAPRESIPTGSFEIAAHWHPVVALQSRLEKLRFRCFVLSAQQLIVPAFGPFKGGLELQPSSDKQLIPIGDYNRE